MMMSTTERLKYIKAMEHLSILNGNIYELVI